MQSHGLEIAAAPFGEAGSAFLSAHWLVEQLGVSQSELAKLVGIARNALVAKSATRKVDAALSPIVRILATAAEMAGGENRAVIWFKHQPIPGWALIWSEKAGQIWNGTQGPVIGAIDPEGRLPTSSHSWQRR